MFCSSDCFSAENAVFTLEGAVCSELAAIIKANNDFVFLVVSRYDSCVVAYLHLMEVVLVVIADNVLARSVEIGESSLGTANVLTFDIDLYLMIVAAYFSLTL